MVAAPIAAIGLMWPKPTDADALLCDLGGPCGRVYTEWVIGGFGFVALQVAFWTAVVAATRWVRLRRENRQLGIAMSATPARP